MQKITIAKQQPLVYYKEEIQLVGKINYYRCLSAQKAEKIIHILCEKFCINKPVVELRKRQSGTYNAGKKRISLPRGWIPIGLVLHEFAHHLDCEKTGKTRHDSILLQMTKLVWEVYSEQH